MVGVNASDGNDNDMIKLEHYRLDRTTVVRSDDGRWCRPGVDDSDGGVRVRHTKVSYSFEGQVNMRRGDGRRTPWFSWWTPPNGHKHGRSGRRSGAISKVRGTKGMDRDRDAVTAAAAIRGHRGYVLASARATVPTQTPRTAWRAPTTRSGRGRRGTLVSGKVRGNRRHEIEENEKKKRDRNAKRNADETCGTFRENGRRQTGARDSCQKGKRATGQDVSRRHAACAVSVEERGRPGNDTHLTRHRKTPVNG